MPKTLESCASIVWDWVRDYNISEADPVRNLGGVPIRVRLGQPGRRLGDAR
jgi:hypothetical protein